MNCCLIKKKQQANNSVAEYHIIPKINWDSFRGPDEKKWESFTQPRPQGVFPALGTRLIISGFWMISAAVKNFFPRWREISPHPSRNSSERLHRWTVKLSKISLGGQITYFFF